MNYQPAIQYTETFKTALEAIQVAAFLRGQDGYIGGRILAPSCKTDQFTVQAFWSNPHADKHGVWTVYSQEWLPGLNGDPDIDDGYYPSNEDL